jgi:hypothetical protein
MTGRMNRRKDSTSTRGLEFAAGLSSRGQKLVGEEEGVKATRCFLNEGLDGSTEGSPPGLVGRGVVPVGDEEVIGATEEDGEIGIGVEEPLAGGGWVGDVSFARAKAGLEMLGTGLEGENVNAKREPPGSPMETKAAQGRSLIGHSRGHQETFPSRSRTTRLRSVSSRMCFFSEAPRRRAERQRLLSLRAMPLVWSWARARKASEKMGSCLRTMRR